MLTILSLPSSRHTRKDSAAPKLELETTDDDDNDDDEITEADDDRLRLAGLSPAWENECGEISIFIRCTSFLERKKCAGTGPL